MKKYSDKDIKLAVKECSNYREVARFLGSENPHAVANLKKRIGKLELDVSHFEGHYKKYSKEGLEEIAKSCTSVAHVTRQLGLSPNNTGYIGLKLKELEVDTSHFSGQSWRKGSISYTKRTPKEILVQNSKRREKGYILRRALLEIGFKEECIECSASTTWQNKFLRLQVDHINGDPCDNRKSNLRFLCPNCHSQTDTFCGKNIKAL